MEKGQREYFLRQQLKAIQQELGEDDPEQAEIAELRERLDALGELPEEVRKAADRELQRLEKLPSAAAEYGVIRTYLEWLLTVPWSTYTEDNLDLEHARKVLDADHFDLEKVKDRIIEYLAVAKLRNEVSGQILCFVGPPGVGKTSLGHSIANALGRKFVRLSVGGVRDESEIRGHRRTYIGSMPGSIIRSLRDAESANPLDPDRRDRQDGQRLARRPGERDARGARPRAEPHLPRPLPRPAVRSLEGALHLHREHARHDPGAVARPHGRDPAVGLHRGREARDREALPPAEAARAARAAALAADALGQDAAHGDPRVHARGGRAQPRAAARRRLPQGGDAGGEGTGAEDPRRRCPAARVARRPALLRRGAQAHLRPRRRHRSRLHRGRRRRALHRSDGVSRQGQAHDHRPARRRDAGVGAGSAVVGAVAHRRDGARPTTGSRATTSTSTFRPARCRRTGRRPA